MIHQLEVHEYISIYPSYPVTVLESHLGVTPSLRLPKTLVSLQLDNRLPCLAVVKVLARHLHLLDYPNPNHNEVCFSFYLGPGLSGYGW